MDRTPYEIFRDIDFSNPTRKRRNGKRHIRLDKKRRARAEKAGGASESARMLVEIENRIGKPIKVKGKDWFLYSGGKWKLVDGGKDPYRSIAWDVQNLANRNVRRTEELLKSIECTRQMKEGEKFYGAINDSDRENFLLNFSNCVLKIDRRSGEIVESLEPNPSFMFTSSLGNYVVDIDCEFFKNTLREILPRKADRALLLDFFTSALLPDSRFECALFCIGNGSNGKSVITEALAGAFGDEVRSATRLHEICHNNRKYVHRLDKKLINVATETDSEPITNDSIFKSIVSGEPFETEKIYKADSFVVQTVVKLCFLMNNAPIFRYGTNAENRRLRFIHFGQIFDEMKRDLRLSEKLTSERDGILSYLVRRLPKVCQLPEMSFGSFVSQRVYETFKTNNDMIGNFISQCVEICPYSTVNRTNLFKVFCEFCRDKVGTVSMTYETFLRVLKRKLPQMGKTRLRNGRQGRTYLATNIQLTDHAFELLQRFRT